MRSPRQPLVLYRAVARGDMTPEQAQAAFTLEEALAAEVKSLKARPKGVWGVLLSLLLIVIGHLILPLDRRA